MSAAVDWMLRIQEPGVPPREHEVRDGLSFGRHESNTCVLKADSWISKRHARIFLEAGQLFLEDLGSANGTQVENGPLLKKGERFQLAPTVRFHLGKTSVEVVQVSKQSTHRGFVPPGLFESPPPPAAAAETPSAPPPRSSAPAPPAAPPSASPPAPAAAPPSASPAAPSASPAAPASASPAAPASASPAAPAAAIPSRPPTPSMHPTPPMSAASAPVDGTIAIASDTGSWRLSAMIAFRPRLVFATRPFEGTVHLPEDRFVVGRELGPDVHHAIGHDNVSGHHAAIIFDGHRFSLEDLGSTNKTWVDGLQAVPGKRVPLEPESHIRFGSIDAIFVVAADANSERISDEAYDSALKILTRTQEALAGQRDAVRQGAQENGRTIGEEIILEGLAPASAWSQAFRKARQLIDAGADLTSDPQPRPLIIVLLLAILLVLLVIAGFVVAKSMGWFGTPDETSLLVPTRES